MLVKQISAFVENRSGRLAQITAILYKNNINIRALSISDTTDFGILRIIVDKPDQAVSALKSNGITVKTTEVFAVCLKDVPGGLANVLAVLNTQEISVEYMYSSFASGANDAITIFRVDDAQKALNILKENEVNIIDASTIQSI